jgi:NADH-quinone oxidoreductase subunit G
MPDVKLTIDGTSVTVPAGTLIVEAAKTIRTDVPVYCYHPKLGPAGLCRICLVDVEKTPKLQIACNTAVAEGMVVHTHGPKVEDGRRAVLEFLLLNHPLDCPICDKGGECDLQDFSMAYGQGASRLAEPKASKPKAIDLGPTIVLDDERCIVCQRCSRFDEIITQERSLVVMDRGQRDVIATASGEPYRSNFSGNVTELCPVGALTSKTYRFKSRPWDLRRTPTTCTQCSVGCELNLDVRHGEILRTMSAPDDETSDGWLCDRGRYNVGFATDARRLASPLLRTGDEWTQIAWDDAIDLWATHLREARAADPNSIATLGGGRLLNEEAYLLQHVMRALGSEQLDWRVGRQRQASPGPLGGTPLDLERARAIVVLGRPPAQTAPVLDLRLRKAVARNGARLVLVGAHAPGSPVDFERVANVAALGDLGLAQCERIAFVWDGIDPAGAELDALARGLEAAGKHVTTFVPGEQGNARGAEAMGLVPRGGGIGTAGILDLARAGKLRVLSLFGANPLAYTPGGPELVRQALAGVPFVVASDLFVTASAALATLVLPALGAFEKNGHVFDLSGDVRPVRAGLTGPPGALADGEMLVALAAELDIALPSPEDLETIATVRASSNASSPTVSNAGPSGLGDLALCGEFSHASESGPASETGVTFRLVVAADPFAGGGTLLFDDRLIELRIRPRVTLSPATAAAAGLHAGDVLDLVAGERALRGLDVFVARDAADGTATVVDGIPDAPASAFVSGETVVATNVRAGCALAEAL